MARLAETQTRASKRSRGAPAVGRQSSIVKIGLILLFAIVPLAVPLYYWSGNQVFPTFQRYFPAQLQAWLPVDSKTAGTAPDAESLSEEQILAACPSHQYTSEIISLDPLVIYINNFTSLAEASSLIDIGSPDFAESFISRSHGPNTLVSGRTSQSAPLDLTHPLVHCILSRARTFMGSMLLPSEPFSIPQLVRYFPGQKYNLHTDFWPEHQIMSDGSGRTFNRAASFFVFLRANCTGGETWFPRVNATRETAGGGFEEWYGDKVSPAEEGGVKFKPVTGNAIFWVNLDKRGEGDRRLIHAGLEVKSGEKIGMNIWPRRVFGNDGDEGEKREERKGWSGKWKD